MKVIHPNPRHHTSQQKQRPVLTPSARPDEWRLWLADPLDRQNQSTHGAHLLEPTLTCENSSKTAYVGVAGRYSNRPDLLEQLRKVVAILSDSRQDDGTDAKVAAERMVRSRRLCDRFSLEDLRVMIDLYRSGTTAREVAEKYGVSLRSIKRLLRQHGVRRER
jgi:hypothetical protein